MTTITATDDLARIEPDDIVATTVPGIYALRQDCIPYEEWELIEDPDEAAQYAADEDCKLMCHVSELYQVAKQSDALAGGWGVSTGNGLAAMTPRYAVCVDGQDIVLAEAYPGAYGAIISARIGY